MYGLIGLFNQALVNEVLLTLGLVVAEFVFLRALSIYRDVLLAPWLNPLTALIDSTSFSDSPPLNAFHRASSAF
jgi:hypothetical protein